MSSTDFVVSDPNTPLGVVTKGALDVERVTVDLTPWLDVGEIIASVSSFSLNPQTSSAQWQTDYPLSANSEPGADTNPLSLLSFLVVDAGTLVEILLASGTPGFAYVVSFVVVGSTSNRRIEIDVFVNIEPLVNTAMLSSSSPAPSTSPIVVTNTQALSAGFVGSVYVENGTGAAITITLPPTPALGAAVEVFDASGDASNHAVHIQGSGGVLIGGQATYDMITAYEYAKFEWMGSAWVMAGSNFVQLQ